MGMADRTRPGANNTVVAQRHHSGIAVHPCYVSNLHVMRELRDFCPRLVVPYPNTLVIAYTDASAMWTTATDRVMESLTCHCEHVTVRAVRDGAYTDIVVAFQLHGVHPI